MRLLHTAGRRNAARIGVAPGVTEREAARMQREWLREKIHRHGRLLTPAELVEQAIGGPLDPAPMLAHLRAKYGALYDL